MAAALESAADFLLDHHATRGADGGVFLDGAALANLDPDLLAGMFVALWRREGWPERDMTAVHYDRLVDLLLAAARREEAAASLPGGVWARGTPAGRMELHRGATTGDRG